MPLGFPVWFDPHSDRPDTCLSLDLSTARQSVHDDLVSLLKNIEATDTTLATFKQFVAEAMEMRHGAAGQSEEDLVEPRGIEPLTSCMPCKRSPN